MISPRCPAIGARRPASPAALASQARADRRQGQQSGSMSKRTIETIARRVAFGLVLAGGRRGHLGGHVSAQQLSADCQRLREAIADASRGDSGAQYQAAADRQRAELDRTVAYAKSIGCDRRNSCSSASAPPPQCGEINAQIGRMRANLDELQQRAGGGPGGRGELIARFNAQCTTAQQPQQQQPANFLDAIFGNLARQPSDVQTVPLNARPAARQHRSRGRLQGGVRAHLRRRVLPGLLFGEPGTSRRARGHVPRALPQRRRLALHLSAVGPDRAGGVDQRREVHGHAQRAEIPPEPRSDLLVQAQGRELGRRARRRRSQARARSRRATSSSRRRSRSNCRGRSSTPRPRPRRRPTPRPTPGGDAEPPTPASTR